MTTLYPSGGGFTGHADRFVDKAFGVAVGWNYWVGVPYSRAVLTQLQDLELINPQVIWFAVLANEYNVVSSIFTVWGPQVPIWGYFLIFWVKT